MPVENKTPPPQEAAQSATTPAKHSRSHSPKTGHHRNVHGKRHASKRDRVLKDQKKTGKDGEAPAVRRISTPAERGPRDEQPADREIKVDDRNEAPAVTGRLITARPAFTPRTAGTGQQGTSKQEPEGPGKMAPPDTLVVQSRSLLETFPGKTPNASPASDSQRGRTLKCSSMVSTVVCGTVVFAVASIVVAAALATKIAVQSYYSALTMRLHLVEELANVCETRGCRQALSLINASCLTSVDICRDFYGFVCGRWDWRAPTGIKPLSYAKILGLNYSSLVDEALARTLSSPQAKDTDGYNIALVYSSCVSFLANTTTNLDNMFKAASVNPRAFLDVNDFSQLFSLTIQTIVKTRLTSVVKVVYFTANTTVGVLTGTSMRSSSFIPEIQEALLEQLASSLEDRSVFKMVDAIEKLDELIRNITEPHLKKTALNEALTARADFPARGVYWKDILKEQVLARPLVSKRLPVARTNSERAIQSIVQKLASAPLEVAKVYLILVPFARYLSFELKVASRRNFLVDSMKANTCVRYLYAMFGMRAHAVLMEVMGTSKAAVRSSQMWQNLKQKSQVLVEVGTGFTLMKDALLNATLKSHKDKPDVSGVLRVLYGNDFMANLIVLARHAEKQTELDPSLLPMESEAEVATEHLVPDFYYDDATEASVNYGTLGGYMARMLFAAGFPKINPRAYVDCVDKYTAHHGIPFDKTDWQRYAKMQWSMNVAFESLPRELTARSPVLQEQFFFLRYAIFLCGEDAPVKKSFQYAVKTSRSFATAFNCYEPPKNPCV